MGLDPYDHVKNLPLAIEVRGPISLLLSYVFSLFAITLFSLFVFKSYIMGTLVL